MNRIYQGRVSSLRFLAEGTLSQPHAIGDPKSCPLWNHHAIFQDAVNYYLTALGAMAGSGSSHRVIRDLRQRLRESWSQHSCGKPNATSLRDSLRRHLPSLTADSEIEAAFDLILAGNEATPECRNAALAELLESLLEEKGDGKIRNGAKNEFPKFCINKTKANFRGEHTRKQMSRIRLILTLHGKLRGQLSDFGALDLATATKREGRAEKTGETVRADLIKHSRKLHAAGLITGSQAAETIERLEAIDCSDLIPIPSYEAGGASREKSLGIPVLLLGKQLGFPSWTVDLLKQLLKLPTNTSKALSSLSDDHPQPDDPLETCRGARGYVFSSYSSLPVWQSGHPGEPAWKDFDVAAFCEALKALNQFHQKTLEREDKLLRSQHLLTWLIGESEHAPKQNDDDDSTPTARLNPSTWVKIRELESELTLSLNEGDWRITPKSLRGFRDIRALWLKATARSATALQKIVTNYQAEEKNRREIGSVPLFFKLAEPTYHPLWDHDADDTSGDEPGGDPLRIATDIHRLEDEIARCLQPIRLTTADPRHSRRMFMFSYLNDKTAKVKYGTTPDPATGEARSYVESAIARLENGRLCETRVRLDYTAPRLDRDELTGGTASRWLQPMTRALGLGDPPAAGVFESACALMPDLTDGRIRHLLNFPINLDPSWIHDGIGKAALWKNQFNRIKDKNLHLHWPGTAKDTTLKAAWWDNPKIIRDGFTLLSNDLGQRAAGAWALIRVTASKPNTNHPCHPIGHDGTREWFAEILQTGIHRLPGEEQRVLESGKWTTERYGSRGRPATDTEYQYASGIARELGIIDPSEWLGNFGGKSAPELNDTLLKLALRRLTRLGTYHRWSCFQPEKLNDAEKARKAIKAQLAELDSYQDEDIKGMAAVLENEDIANFRKLAGDAFSDLRTELQSVLVRIANRICPLRGREWQWLSRGAPSLYGDLISVKSDLETPKIRGQRGLSMDRLEQLEDLRRVFLRYNRSLDREPRYPAKTGREDRGRDSGEPCQELLDKLDRMKEERVNQTAHLILAQALGLRLKPHEMDAKERTRRDIHGEYEKIPGREPVDFIVIEDLSRYRSSQGRAPSENSRLMKWSHRAIRDKLKMLAEEPFGIPLVEVIPAYSSRFHAGNGQAGARLHEENALSPYQLAGLEKLSNNKDKSPAMRAAAAELLNQFKALELANDSRVMDKRKPHTLYYPKAGGPLFLAAKDGSPVQADTNAAANLGLRAIAAPECLAILRRVRAVKSEGVNWKARAENAREKAAFGKDNDIRLKAGTSKKLAASSSPNFFYEPDGIVGFDAAEWNGHRLVSGVALWSTVNDAVFIRCAALNRARLEKWLILPVTPDSPQPSGDDSDDQIPI